MNKSSPDMTREEEVRVSAAFECIALDMAEVNEQLRLAQEAVHTLIATMERARPILRVKVG